MSIARTVHIVHPVGSAGAGAVERSRLVRVLRGESAIVRWVLIMHSGDTDCPYLSTRVQHIHIVAICDTAVDRSEWARRLAVRDYSVRSVDGAGQLAVVLRMLHQQLIVAATDPSTEVASPAGWEWWQPDALRDAAVTAAPDPLKPGAPTSLEDALSLTSDSDTPNVPTSAPKPGIVAQRSMTADLARMAEQSETRSQRSKKHDDFSL